MNPSFFSQSSTGIPGGPLPTRSAPKKSSNKKPVAAVIRPVPRQLGKEGSLRVDPADSSPLSSHARGYSLSDYVTWLREKIEADEANSKQEAQSQAQSQVPAPKAKQNFSPTREVTDGIFSTITDTDLVQVLDDRNVSAKTPRGVRFEEIALGYAKLNDPPVSETVQRIDPAHPVESPAPSELSRKAMFPYSEMFDLSNASEESGAVEGGDTQAFINAVSKAIASVITEMPEPVFEQRVREHFKTETHSSAAQEIAEAKRLDELKREELESAESDEATPAGSNYYFGIEDPNQPEASGITQPAHFESLEETFDIQPEPTSDEPVVAQLASATPLVSMPTTAEKVANKILSKTSKEIPTGVAAWDVEDFRWPVVTNQMIVSGGQAIDHLAESVFGLLSPSSQRLAITGLSRGDGTSSIAISLARWVAAFGKNVLLVDADLTSPVSLSNQIGLAPNLSWINAISQNLPAAEVIVRSQKMNLCVMPLAPMVSRAAWPRFIYDNLGELIDQVRSYFDLVIVDSGPSSQLLAELSRPRHMVDATLMVHDGEESPEFRQAKSMLEGFGLDRFVVAKNRVHGKTVNAA